MYDKSMARSARDHRTHTENPAAGADVLLPGVASQNMLTASDKTAWEPAF
jgi:hypothetical protein